MELSFENTKLRTLCEDTSFAQEALGVRVAKKLQSRLADLYDAVSILDIIVGNPRNSSNRPDSYYIIDLIDDYQIILKCNHTARIPKDCKGHIDWSRVTRVKVIKIDKPNERN